MPLSATWSQSSFYGMHRMFVMNPCMGPSFTHFFYTLGTIAVDFGIRFYFEIVQFYIHETAVNCQVLSQYVHCLHPCKFEKNPLYTWPQCRTYTCHKCTLEKIVTYWRPSHFHFHYSDILHTVSHAVSTCSFWTLNNMLSCILWTYNFNVQCIKVSVVMHWGILYSAPIF